MMCMFLYVVMVCGFHQIGATIEEMPVLSQSVNSQGMCVIVLVSLLWRV